VAKKEKVDHKELTEAELRQRLHETRAKLFEMKFQSATAPLKNPKAITAARREVARLLTFLRQKAAKPSPAARRREKD
jgi:large subunit ribosomal protein L29